MSSMWHWFVIIGTIGSLLAMLWLLLANRQTTGEEDTGHEWDGIKELDNPLPMWWVGMFVISIVFTFGYLIYYPGLGNVSGVGNWTSEAQWQAETEAFEARFAPLYAELAALTPEEMAENRQAQQVGRRLFINYCATCHGVNAEGAPGFPNLTDDHWIWGDSYDAILTTINLGRTGIMPGWGPMLGEQGVTDTTQYVLKLSGREHDAAAAERGAEHYAKVCVACHGVEGGGNTTLGAPPITNDKWLYGGDPESIAYTIRVGRTGMMPAQGELLGPERARILAAYVKTLQQ